MALLLTQIAARQSAYLTKKLLAVGEYADIYGGMGMGPVPQKTTIPAHETKTAQFRRYESKTLKTSPLTEGVTPDATQRTVTDATVALVQYGDYTVLTDLSVDLVEDPVLTIEGDRQGNEAIGAITLIREGTLIAGTNVLYSAGTARTDVTALIGRALIEKAARTLSTNKARRLTKMLASTDGYNTTPIPACYVGVCHSYIVYDLRVTIGESNDFVPVEKYSKTAKLFPKEVGKVGAVRFIEHEDMTYYADAGGTKGSGHKSTTGTSEDVFATLIFGEESYGIVQFGGYKGNDGVQAIVKPLGSGGTEDPLNQRATVGWKSMQGAIRLNENWMIRVETGATA